MQQPLHWLCFFNYSFGTCFGYFPVSVAVMPPSQAHLILVMIAHIFDNILHCLIIYINVKCLIYLPTLVSTLPIVLVINNIMNFNDLVKEVCGFVQKRLLWWCNKRSSRKEKGLKVNNWLTGFKLLVHTIVYFLIILRGPRKDLD